MRVYIPLTAPMLDQINLRDASGTLEAYAVSPALRAANPGVDEEELEFEAMLDAAYASATMATGPRFALIASADIKDSQAKLDQGSTRLTFQGSIAWNKVASFHVSEGPVDDADEYEPQLMWFDATEREVLQRFLAA